MRLFQLSNHIFELELDAQELSVYAYLCSLPGSGKTLQDAVFISVKQRTIAANCGIKSPVTVAKTIDRLHEKGLVDYLERNIKANGHQGTYCYAITKQPTDVGFFTVDRRVFGMLTPRQMLVYLFLCKSFSTVLHDCWNSYNDISAQTGMKRESVIQTTNELVAGHFITRYRRRSKDNPKVFVDNHYRIVLYVRGHIKRKMRLQPTCNRTKDPTDVESLDSSNSNTNAGLCQAPFQARGSPKFASHY